jgi:quercetin dioxygenase-like cupin family protein
MQLQTSGIGSERVARAAGEAVAALEEAIWIEYEPGSITHPEPMSHPGEENAVCLEGSVVVIIEGQEFVLNEGDSISFESGRLHQVENRSEERAVLVSAITPPAF